MIKIDPIELTERENYKLLSGSVIPRPIAWITSKHENGNINIAPFSFFNMVSSNPPIIAVSIGRKNGQIEKHTAKNILKTNEFVVHLPSNHLLKKMNDSSAPYSEGVSEVEKIGLTLVNSDVINTPGIKEAKIRLECVLYQSIPLGENGYIQNDLILGKIVRYHFSEDVYEDGKINAKALDPIARLAGPNYATLSENIYLPRPEVADE